MITLENLQARIEKLQARIGESVDWRQACRRPANTDAPVEEEETDTVADVGEIINFATRPWKVAGWSIIGVFMVGGTLLAGATKIDGAAIASGTVGVESNRKSVTHLEGGIVKDILVQEGQRVHKGDVMVRMDDTRAHATLELLQGRMDALTVKKARLEAERRDLASIEFPPEILDRATDAKLLDLMDGEMAVLDTRRKNLERQDRILRERIQKQSSKIRGLKAKRVASIKRLDLLKDELKMMNELLQRGLVARNRVLSLERSKVETEGDIHDLAAKIAQSGDEIAKLELERALGVERHQKEVAADHQETRERIAEVSEKIRAARDILDRTAVVAPTDGVVVALRQHTPGGVVQGGEPILDLVPDHDRPVIELRIDPNDIDVVYAGQTARVRLSAFNARTTPMIEGKVVQISADRLVDPQTGAGYFSGRVMPLTQQNADVPALAPGMQAEVFLLTARRSVLDYMLDPLVRTLGRAGREL